MGKSEKRDCWLGCDLGGTKMLATVFDGEWKPLGRKRRKTRGHEGTKAGLQRLVETMADALDDAGLNSSRLRGAGIGTPGPVDTARGVVPSMPNLAWKDADIKRSVERALGCPAVVVNDVDAGVYAEYRIGAARGARCVLGAFPGTGIGGGCVYEGRILQGSALSCLEIGHLPVMPEGPACGCGQRGCLEAVASRLAVSAAAAAAAYRGDAPWLLDHHGMDLAAVRSGALADSIRNGDTAVEQIVRRAARWLGVGVAAVVNLLLPDVVVLGGGLVKEMPELYRSEVEDAARARVISDYAETFAVRVAALGDDATVTGAAMWAAQAGA